MIIRSMGIAIAAVLADEMGLGKTMQAITSKVVLRSGSPPAARKTATKAKGRAKRLCSNLSNSLNSLNLWRIFSIARMIG